MARSRLGWSGQCLCRESLYHRNLARMINENKGQRLFIDAPYSLKEEDVFPPTSTLSIPICSYFGCETLLKWGILAKLSSIGYFK